MSQAERNRRGEAKRERDTSTDTWMKQCANCDDRTEAGMQITGSDGEAWHRPIPLCRNCINLITPLTPTWAGTGAIVSLCQLMQERTGEVWFIERDDE